MDGYDELSSQRMIEDHDGAPSVAVDPAILDLFHRNSTDQVFARVAAYNKQRPHSWLKHLTPQPTLPYSPQRTIGCVSPTSLADSPLLHPRRMGNKNRDSKCPLDESSVTGHRPFEQFMQDVIVGMPQLQRDAYSQFFDHAVNGSSQSNDDEGRTHRY